MQRRELPDAVARGDHCRRARPPPETRPPAPAASATSAACVNSVRNRTPSGCRDAPVGEPQFARVALDDVEQREAERAAGVCIGGCPAARAARERTGSSAPSPTLDPLAREDSAVGAGSTERLAERDVHVPRADPHLHDAAPVDHRRLASPRSPAPRRATPARGSSPATRAPARHRRRTARRPRTPPKRAPPSTRRARSAA